MLLDTERARLNLANDEVARLTDACDSRLEVTAGFAWVTVEGEREDIVLAAGESWIVDTTDVVRVSALRGPAAIEVRAHVGAKRCRETAARAAHRPTRLQQTLARFSLSAVAFV